MLILYFGRLREAFGCGSEARAVPQEATVAGLLRELRLRGGVWEKELARDGTFRVAVDQTVAAVDAPLADASEVAIFPPVTGG